MKFESLIKYVLPEVQGAPDPLIIEMIRESAIQFCEKTNIYTTEPENIFVTTGLREYDIDAPTTQAQVNHIVKIWGAHGNDNTEMVAKAPDDVYRYTSTDTGAPQFYSQITSNQIIIAPFPDKAYTLRSFTSFKPTNTATSLPDNIMKEHYETIVHGALYRLQQMADRTWSNPNASANNFTLNNKGISAAARRARYGYAGASLTVKAVEFI